jgi:taurine transport system permease protein
MLQKPGAVTPEDLFIRAWKAPRARRLRPGRPSRSTAVSAAALLAFIVAWWLVTRLRVVSGRELVPPRHLLHSYRVLWTTGYQGIPLRDEIEASLRRCVLGFGIGAGIATPLGLVIGSSRRASALISPIVALFRPIPPIAYLPLLVLLLGIGEEPKVLMIASGAFFYMLLTTAAGVRAVPRSLVDAGRMLGLSRRQLFGSVVFRAALPSILIGANVALVISWATVVAAELVSAQKGLGFIAVDAAQYARTDYVYAAVILIGIIGALFELGIRLLERMLVPWAGR